MRFAAILLACAAVTAWGCGRRGVVKAKPIGPKAYVISANDRPAPGQFIRYKPAGVSYGGLDIATVKYSPASGGKGPDLLFVGVVHVADRIYYDGVQEELDACPTVLFEAIKPDELSVSEWWEGAVARHDSGAALQSQLAKWFGFEYQLAAIDYRNERFVHCDMSASAFKEQGGMNMVPGLSSKNAGSSDIQSSLDKVRSMGEVLFRPNSPMSSIGRKIFAETLGRQDLASALAMFPEMEELILRKRNEIVLERLADWVGEGTRGPVAIFFGAAHGPGIEKGILERYGYERVDGWWRRAWATRPPVK